MKIDSAAIKKLASLLEETGLNEIEVAEGDSKIRVKKQGDGPVSYAAAPAAATGIVPASTAPAAPASSENHPGALKSPMVGTCYMSSEPGAPAFVKKGDSISVGDTICIIEAMKVMNPIKATKAGVVKDILVSDAQPVEFGEVLIVIE